MSLLLLVCVAVLAARLVAELSCAIAPDGHDEFPCSMEAPCASVSFAVSMTGCTDVLVRGGTYAISSVCFNAHAQSLVGNFFFVLHGGREGLTW